MCFYSFQFGKLRETASQENVKRSLLMSNNMPSRTKSLLAMFPQFCYIEPSSVLLVVYKQLSMFVDKLQSQERNQILRVE